MKSKLIPARFGDKGGKIHLANAWQDNEGQLSLTTTVALCGAHCRPGENLPAVDAEVTCEACAEARGNSVLD